MRRFENDTFESVFFKSVEIESVVVSAHPHYIRKTKDGSLARFIWSAKVSDTYFSVAILT